MAEMQLLLHKLSMVSGKRKLQRSQPDKYSLIQSEHPSPHQAPQLKKSHRVSVLSFVHNLRRSFATGNIIMDRIEVL